VEKLRRMEAQWQNQFNQKDEVINNQAQQLSDMDESLMDIQTKLKKTELKLR